jgi:hypothetical protein
MTISFDVDRRRAHPEKILLERVFFKLFSKPECHALRD